MVAEAKLPSANEVDRRRALTSKHSPFVDSRPSARALL